MTTPTRTSAPRVLGRVVDAETRCAHYHGPLDVVALQFKCCEEFYPCFACHEETAGHPTERWNTADGNRHAVLCGVCRTAMRIDDYLRAEACPSCSAPFNPGCRLHRHHYFDLTETS